MGGCCQPQGFCRAWILLPRSTARNPMCCPKLRVLREVSSAAWACFLKTLVKPFPSLVMKGFTVCCNEPLKGKIGGKILFATLLPAELPWCEIWGVWGKLSLVRACSLLSNPLVFLLWHLPPAFPPQNRVSHCSKTSLV